MLASPATWHQIPRSRPRHNRRRTTWPPRSGSAWTLPPETGCRDAAGADCAVGCASRFAAQRPHPWARHAGTQPAYLRPDHLPGPPRLPPPFPGPRLSFASTRSNSRQAMRVPCGRGPASRCRPATTTLHPDNSVTGLALDITGPTTTPPIIGIVPLRGQPPAKHEHPLPGHTRPAVRSAEINRGNRRPRRRTAKPRGTWRKPAHPIQPARNTCIRAECDDHGSFFGFTAGSKRRAVGFAPGAWWCTRPAAIGTPPAS